jgi:hypothetical protein
MRRRHHFLRSALVLAAGAALLAGCGAPEYFYPKSSEHKTYLKVPSSWRALDQETVNEITFGDAESTASRQQRDASWAVAYDAAPEPDVNHFMPGYPTDAPTVRAAAVALDAQAQASISFDLLRDFRMPVTPSARQASEQDPNFRFTDFELLSEELLNPEPGLRGVHVVYNYRSPFGQLQTFDQTALTNDATSVLYVLELRCSAQCYQDRQEEIQDVVTSFTVRRK